MEITLEKVDKVIERTGVSYKVAKQALEETDGNILDAIIYLEDKNISFETEENKNSENVEEFKEWLKDLINKGNISRVKIKKDEKVLVDIPVNAGIAAAAIAIIIPQILALGIIAAVATKITIEITKADGTVEVVNKYVSKATDEVVNKASNVAEEIKSRISEMKDPTTKKQKVDADDTVFTYEVNFDDEDE